MIMRAFITSQFNYCPLVWMCYSRTRNNKINKLHKRAPRLIYNHRQLTYEELFDKDNSFSIHHRNLQVFATETYKVHSYIAPDIMNDIFEKKEISFNLRNNAHFTKRNIKSAYYGSEKCHI